MEGVKGVEGRGRGREGGGSVGGYCVQETEGEGGGSGTGEHGG